MEKDLRSLLERIEGTLSQFAAKAAATESALVVLITELSSREAIDGASYVNRLRRVATHQDDFAVREHVLRIALDAEESLRLMRGSPGAP